MLAGTRTYRDTRMQTHTCLHTRTLNLTRCSAEGYG
jgi:predicted SpoU family rRNA methylase